MNSMYPLSPFESPLEDQPTSREFHGRMSWQEKPRLEGLRQPGYFSGCGNLVQEKRSERLIRFNPFKNY